MSDWISALTMEAIIKPEVKRLAIELRWLGHSELAAEFEAADWRGKFNRDLIKRAYATLQDAAKYDSRK